VTQYLTRLVTVKNGGYAELTRLVTAKNGR